MPRANMNTEAVAMGHYLKVRDSDFARTSWETTFSKAGPIRAHTGAESAGLKVSGLKGEFVEVHSGQADAHSVASSQTAKVTPMGFEPMSPP